MKDIHLRKVENKDMMLLYQWVNDPLVRKNSFNSGNISLEEHQKWFNEKFKNPNESIYILMVGEKSIGQVRLSKSNKQVIISYSIDSKYRGQGYGKLILKLVEDKINDENIKLIGRVKRDNIASQLIFQSLNYEKEEFDNYFEYTKIVNQR